jgi:hypothetical protein
MASKNFDGLQRICMYGTCTVKKVFVFPSPAAGMSPKLSLAGNNLTITGQGEFV